MRMAMERLITRTILSAILNREWASIMDENELPESERLQFSLKALFTGALIASVMLGLVVTAPTIFGPLTLLTVVLGVPAWCFAKKKPFWGFFFIALFVFVLPFIGFAQTILLPKMMNKRRVNPDRNLVMALKMALSKYEMDYQTFPPVGSFKNSSAALFDALTQRTADPYIHLNAGHFISKSGTETMLVSKAGDPLHYTPFQNSEGKHGYMLVFPGNDRLLGGTLSTENGFVPDNSDANGDGLLDHLDNIIEQVTSN